MSLPPADHNVDRGTLGTLRSKTRLDMEAFFQSVGVREVEVACPPSLVMIVPASSVVRPEGLEQSTGPWDRATNGCEGLHPLAPSCNIDRLGNEGATPLEPLGTKSATG